MATSENLNTIHSWAYRPNLSDSCFTDYKDKSFHNSVIQNDVVSVSSFLNLINHDVSATTAPTSSAACLSGGTDHESAPKRRALGVTGKVSKRKSRAASKRSQTTFITADPANFRQMVQQVTGVSFRDSDTVTMVPVLKPEPQRVTGGVAGGYCLPTLDTSAFLLENQQQQVVGPNSAGTGPGFYGVGPLGMVDSSFGISDLDFDTFSNFPTLESWKLCENFI